MEESSNILDFVSGLGAIGSVFGAGVAWLQYRKARDSASEASKIELRLMDVMKQKDLVKEVEKIKALVKKLGRYVRRGQNISRQGLSIEDDLAEVTDFRNDFKATYKHSETFKKELDEIFNLLITIDFNKAEENERIDAISSLIESLNTIAVAIDHEANKND
ncbi:hypothetical protein V9R55_003475 [Vibrio cholerae]|nr:MULTISPECIES: hypothetical protein [Vibrio]EJL6485467.1 hypothetical protein [Vibrio cholerae]NOI46244.1 hypothetical protein [Vibrio alginolyticus]TQQ47432.1 hypothetical protein FLL62_16680 [Vibrio cholerae]